MSENIELKSRDYEVSIWTLQDSYLATLKWSGIELMGQIEQGLMEITDDGTENLSFRIPMYLYQRDGSVMIKKENPSWASVENKIIILNMRKIKVIFNKTFSSAKDKKDAGERIFEFLITKVTEEHEDDQSYCNVECEGLAFHELGKQGYKYELSSDLYFDRLEKYYSGETWYDNLYRPHTRASDEKAPIPTLDYWMNDIGIEKLPENNINPTKWYYSVEMNWDSYSYINGGARESDKLYEDAYATSWNNDLNPVAMAPVEEKQRFVDANESNIYNLTLTIAETFLVFCRYEYLYDENYHIIGKKIVFYNNFIKDDSPILELTYPYTSEKISREYDSVDLTTKMFVRPETDDTTVTGLISIMDSDANPTREDWVMNFDYLYENGTISKELYDEVENYKKKIRVLNLGDDNSPGLIKLLQQLRTALERKIVVDANVKVAENSKTLASEREADAQAHVEATSGVETVTYICPALLPLIEVESERNTNAGTTNYYIKIGSLYEGIDESSIRVYKKYVDPLPTTGSASEKQAAVFPDLYPESKLDITTSKKFEIDFTSGLGKKAIDKYISLYPKSKESADISMKNDAQYREYIITRFNDWVTNINNFASTSVALAPVPNYDFLSSSNENLDSYYTRYNGNTSGLKTDLLGWILFALGYASIDKIHNTRFKKTGVKSITFNGTLYKLSVKKATGNHSSSLPKDHKYIITKDSWRKLNSARAAWRISLSAGIQPSDITIATDAATGRPSWNKNENDSKKVTVIYDANNVVKWLYGNSVNPPTSTSLHTLYTEINGYNSDYDFLDATGYKMIFNEFKNFTVKKDLYDNIIQISDLYGELGLHKAYLTFTYNPSTYYTNIYDMWHKKYLAASTDYDIYKEELDNLEEEIDTLLTDIHEVLKAKLELTNAFNRMMGPALRESYWLPENYHNYGDYYLENPNGYFFSAATPSTSNGSKTLFIWDSELFSEEEKNYYLLGVNQTKKYYPMINLDTYIKALTTAEKIKFFESVTDKTLCFAFYNDILDKADSNGQIKPLRLEDATGKWYYEDSFSNTMLAASSTFAKSGKKIINTTINVGTIIRKTYVKREEKDRVYYMLGASMNFGFVKNTNNRVIPVLIFNEMSGLPDTLINFILQIDTYPVKLQETHNGQSIYVIHPGAQPRLGYKDTSDNFLEFNTKIHSSNMNYWITTPANYTTVYPRIVFDTIQIKTSSIILNSGTTYGEYLLEKNNHYYILPRNEKYYLTIKPIVFLDIFDSALNSNSNRSLIRDYYNDNNITSMNPFTITYSISNGGTYVYIDAIKVIKENSVPKVEYTVTPNIAYSKMSNTLYNYLDSIVMINDSELKLDNVFGYISSIKLKFDKPQEDEIEVKNYKNKFEDLFSSISAETEEMKKNGGILSSLNTGLLPPILENNLYSTINNINEENIYNEEDYIDTTITDALNSIFSEARKILDGSEEILDDTAILNLENASILASMVEDIKAQTIPSVYYGTKASISGEFKPGDVLIDENGKKYIASAIDSDQNDSDIWVPFYDGTVSEIKGALMECNAETGIINILGEHEINLKGGNVTIAANAVVDIIGNESVNIGGATVNIVAGGEDGETGGINLVTTSYLLDIPAPDEILDIDAQADYYNTAGVFIHPEEITMVGSKITMKGSNEILMKSSLGTLNTTSAMKISSADGIWIGTGNEKGIRLYASDINYTESDIGNMDITDSRFTSGSSVEILGKHILFGSISTNSGTTSVSAIRIKGDEIVIGSGTKGDLETNLNKDIGGTGENSGLIGAKFTANSIGFATSSGNNITALLMNSSGIVIGSGEAFDALNPNGSYVKIGTSGIKIGSNGYLNASTNNIIINSLALNTASVFELKNGNTSVLKYTANGTLSIVVDELSIKTDNTTLTLNNYLTANFAITKSKVWAAITDTDEGTSTALSLTKDSILLNCTFNTAETNEETGTTANLSHTTSLLLNQNGITLAATASALTWEPRKNTYISITEDGIKMSGAHVYINESEEWSRDDLIWSIEFPDEHPTDRDWIWIEPIANDKSEGKKIYDVSSGQTGIMSYNSSHASNILSGNTNSMSRIGSNKTTFTVDVEVLAIVCTSSGAISGDSLQYGSPKFNIGLKGATTTNDNNNVICAYNDSNKITTSGTAKYYRVGSLIKGTATKKFTNHSNPLGILAQPLAFTILNNTSLYVKIKRITVRLNVDAVNGRVACNVYYIPADSR